MHRPKISPESIPSSDPNKLHESILSKTIKTLRSQSTEEKVLKILLECGLKIRENQVSPHEISSDRPILLRAIRENINRLIAVNGIEITIITEGKIQYWTVKPKATSQTHQHPLTLTRQEKIQRQAIRKERAENRPLKFSAEGIDLNEFGPAEVASVIRKTHHNRGLEAVFTYDLPSLIHFVNLVACTKKSKEGRIGKILLDYVETVKEIAEKTKDNKLSEQDRRIILKGPITIFEA